MTSRPECNTSTESEFALKLARSTARSLFDTKWNVNVEVCHVPGEFDDEDDDYIETLPEDVTKPASKRSWEVSETPLAVSMTEAEIAAAVKACQDPWAQSSHARGRACRDGDPPPSLIATALAAAEIVQCEPHLHSLFEPGHVTNMVCPAGPFLWGLDQMILPIVIGHWEGQLPSQDTADLHRIVEDETVPRRNPRQKRGMLDTRVERSLAQGASVLLVTTGEVQLSDALNALFTRKCAWPGLTPQIVVETLRLTHSTTGQLAEAEIRRRLPDPDLLKAFGPGQVDAAFAAPTTLLVADRLAQIAGKLTPAVPKLTLDAVRGLGSVRQSLNRMVNDLRLWRDGALAWTDVAASAVFHGPPGTGKTTLAKAFAGSAGLPIITTSYSDCQKHGHQGDMLAALDQAFAEAKQAAPAVLFIDELDSFSQRNAPHQNASYLRGVVNGLLEQINRAKDVDGLFLFGATNHLETVDPAVIRSGRFDLKLHVPYPDKAGLEAILIAKLGIQNAAEVDTGTIADRLIGLSGADVEAVARDALGRARADGVPVNDSHLESAADQIVPQLDEETIWRAAIHEAGHVVVMMQLGWPVPHRVCLTANGGQVEHTPPRSLTLGTAREQLCILLAGRAAEICVFGAPSSGAGLGEQSDLAKATSLALAIERHWGFGESGLLWDGISAAEVWRAPAEVRGRAEAHLREAQEKALAILRANLKILESLAKQLLRVRDMSGRDIELVEREITVRKEPSSSAETASVGQNTCLQGGV